MADVLHKQCEKLIHRHPHIYGDLMVADEEEVKRNWEQLKLQEGKSQCCRSARFFTRTHKAYRIQDKAGQVKLSVGGDRSGVG